MEQDGTFASEIIRGGRRRESKSGGVLSERELHTHTHYTTVSCDQNAFCECCHIESQQRDVRLYVSDSVTSLEELLGRHCVTKKRSRSQLPSLYFFGL